jgi:phosphoserine aminotransferase
VFAQSIDWSKADVITFSWQKALGGEASHGMLVLSPRAIDRLETHTPPWPMPKLFRLTKAGKLDEAIFEGQTINTPSMLCVEDYLESLAWADRIGGLSALIGRADANAKILHDWISRTPWVANLASDPATRSNTSVCLKIVDPGIIALGPSGQARFAAAITTRLEVEKIANDVGSYRDAPPGLRIWTGPTIECRDLELLTPWLEWAFAATKAEFGLAG